MWSLKAVSGENICAFKQFDYEPAQGVATLVFGRNLDDDSQDSNGSGKSAIVESIAIAILGTPLRKAKMEEIINDFENNATVSLTLENPVLDQTLTVIRVLDRKADQKVFVKLNDEDVVMPNVAEYNRYILESIGLNRDQILSTYILCANHFHSFLDTSDREKKDIINRFSNGIMVDQSIAEVRKDLVSAKNEQVEIEKEHAARNARVTTLREEIENFWGQAEHRETRRKEMIAAHKEAIANEHQKIRESNDAINSANESLDRLVDIEEELGVIENTPDNINETNRKIREVLERYGLKTISGRYVDSYVAAQTQLQDNENKLKDLHKHMEELLDAVKAAQKKVDEAKDKYAMANEKAKFDSKDLEAKKTNFGTMLVKTRTSINEYVELIHETQKSIGSINSILAGVITCPKCSHQFVLNSSKTCEQLEDDLKQLRGDLEKYTQKELSSKKDEKQICDTLQELDDLSFKIISKVNEAKTELSNVEVNYRTVYNDFSSCNHSEARYKQSIESARKTISTLRTEMFDEAFKRLDEEEDDLNEKIKSEEKIINIANGNIKAYEEAVEKLEKTNADEGLEDIKDRLKQAEASVEETAAALQGVTARIERLAAQEMRFLQFKTHLANTKIDALSAETNAFLEHIGSCLRIRFSGFTVLKTGKVRDKISISMERNGIDCGSFGKLSVGEKSRGILANVLAMHKLCNANCPDGRGLNFLVLDEILDSTDETGIARTADTLSELGLTSIVITHIAVADSYPHRLVVTKHNGFSTIRKK